MMTPARHRPDDSSRQRNRAHRWLQAALVVILTCSGPATHSHAASARIAIAANFTAAAKHLGREFNQHSEHQVTLSFGSTGKLFTQIMHGAPFDAFLSADQQRPARLLAQNQAVIESNFTYAVGQLVLFSHDEQLPTQAGALLHSPNLQRLAIANPKTAPYGAAAREVLQALAPEFNLQGKIIQGDSIVQTYQFAFTGNADAGFVALAQIINHSDANFWPVPQSLYSPLKQDAVLLTRGENNPAARAFLAYLRTPRARQIILQHGYREHSASSPRVEQ